MTGRGQRGVSKPKTVTSVIKQREVQSKKKRRGKNSKAASFTAPVPPASVGGPRYSASSSSSAVINVEEMDFSSDHEFQAPSEVIIISSDDENDEKRESTFRFYDSDSTVDSVIALPTRVQVRVQPKQAAVWPSYSILGMLFGTAPMYTPERPIIDSYGWEKGSKAGTGIVMAPPYHENPVIIEGLVMNPYRQAKMEADEAVDYLSIMPDDILTIILSYHEDIAYNSTWVTTYKRDTGRVILTMIPPRFVKGFTLPRFRRQGKPERIDDEEEYYNPTMSTGFDTVITGLAFRNATNL